MRERPLSPHLSVYRFKYTLTTSISNRVSGLVLSLALPVLVYWLMAAANGAEAYARARELLGHPLARVIYAVLLLAWSYHLLNGIRHLVWDTGRGLERRQSQKSAWFVGIASIVLALTLIYVTLFSRGGTP